MRERARDSSVHVCTCGGRDPPCSGRVLSTEDRITRGRRESRTAAARPAPQRRGRRAREETAASGVAADDGGGPLVGKNRGHEIDCNTPRQDYDARARDKMRRDERHDVDDKMFDVSDCLSPVRGPTRHVVEKTSTCNDRIIVQRVVFKVAEREHFFARVQKEEAFRVRYVATRGRPSL